MVRFFINAGLLALWLTLDLSSEASGALMRPELNLEPQVGGSMTFSHTGDGPRLLTHSDGADLGSMSAAASATSANPVGPALAGWDYHTPAPRVSRWTSTLSLFVPHPPPWSLLRPPRR